MKMNNKKESEWKKGFGKKSFLKKGFGSVYSF